MGAILSKINGPHYDAIASALAKQITFTTAENPTPLELTGRVDLAFQGLTFVHMMEVDARAFYINFFESLSALQSGLLGLAQPSHL